MKIYKNLFLLLILCIMSNACEDNSAVNPYVDMSEFEIACKVTGGIYENGKCKCNNAFCDEGEVCNVMTKQCDDNSAANPYVEMSEFEIACKVTGGIYENGKCKCNNAFCDEGDVCNMATAKCPEKQIPEVCAKDSVTCTNSMMYRCNNNHNFVEDKIC